MVVASREISLEMGADEVGQRRLASDAGVNSRLRPPPPRQEGLAEIIVAKNRNGPTGKVKLAFLEHLTKFANLAGGRAPKP